MAYIGTSPSNGVRRVLTYTATANQTTFTGTSSEGITLTYSDGNYVDVFQNGVLLGTADYTATSGTSIVLVQGASVNDIIVIIVYDVFSVADTVSQSGGGTFNGAVIVNGNLDATGAVTAGTLDVTGVATATTFEPDGDTAAGDNAAIGYTAAEGLILTGQGSTSDVTVKNDADATVFTVPTGTDDILFPDNAKILMGTGSDFKLYHDSSNSYIDNVTGAVHIRTNNTENSIIAYANAQVELYHNAVKKLETTANGITASGTITANRSGADQNILGEVTSAGHASRLQLKAANYSGGSYNAIQSFQGDAGAAWEISGAKANATNIMKFTVGNTMAMEIQGNGFVTVPAQVHALFEKTSNTACGSGAVVFPLFNEQRINTGSSYNSTNGRFTAPVAGRYQFSVDFQCNGQYNQMHLGMYMNGGAIGNIDPWVNYGDSMRGANRSLTINLAAGDYLQAAVHFGNNSGTLEANRHRASFYLLG